MPLYPSRIICLSAEAADILSRLGCSRRIVGVTAFATHSPALRLKPKVGGFSSINYRKIEELQPDLLITFSDVQAEAARELVRRGYTVLATNPRTLKQIFETIELLGRMVGRERAAARLLVRMNSALAARNHSRTRPSVYFEEWDDPMISGIGWIGELIERAGGRDIFPELSSQARATDRVVRSEEVVRRRPDLIFASWCGKKVASESFAKRPGWDSVPAVRAGRIYEVPAADILQPGPGLLRGFKFLQRVINCFDD